MILGPVPCQGCRSPVVYALGGEKLRPESHVARWRDPLTMRTHRCNGTRVRFGDALAMGTSYNGTTGSSSEPSNISSDARPSATARGAGVVSSIEVVAR